MKIRVKKFEEKSPGEFLVLRERLGLGRYRKGRPRDAEERAVLLDLGLKKIEEKEKDDYILVSFRKRIIRMPAI